MMRIRTNAYLTYEEDHKVTWDLFPPGKSFHDPYYMDGILYGFERSIAFAINTIMQSSENMGKQTLLVIGLQNIFGDHFAKKYTENESSAFLSKDSAYMKIT